MSAPERDERTDRSWTIAPALLWFAGFLVLALILLDGGVQALADRLTARRAPEATRAAGPAFTARRPSVAEANATDDATDDAANDDDSAAGGGPSAAKPAAPGPGEPAGGKRIVAAKRDKILVLEDNCLDGTPDHCKRWAMDAFYRAFGDAKAKKLGRPVRVSWYGDSVIATDAIPSRLRALLQGEVGDGGPGYVYVVPPHRFCANESITRTSTGNWTTHAISTTQLPDGLYGVGGSTAETDGGKATIKLAAGTVSQVELYYLAQPHGGTATLTADGKPLATVATKAAAKLPGYAAATVPGGAQKFDLAAAGKLRVFGLSLENPGGGVVDNLGIVSVSLKSFRANNADHFRAELGHRAADLIMIMIGANEAQWLAPADQDTKDYTAQYGKLLADVRAARPDASCLVVSPTDQAEGKDGDYPSRAVMPTLVMAQRKAALASGCAFYSTYDWMGGKGSAAKWFRKGLVGTDFQHLSRKGANKLSESLFGTLMLGYQKYASP